MANSQLDQNRGRSLLLASTLLTTPLAWTGVTLGSTVAAHVAIVDGSGNQVSNTSGLPVLAIAQSTDSYPMYSNRSLGGGPIGTDSAGALQTYGGIVTDEGAARANWTGSALSTSPGTATFTNGSTVVTGTGFSTVDLHYLDYIKLNADGETAWQQVSFVNSDTSITLAAAYTGTGGTGTYNLAQAATITGTGATVSVASGQLTMALGTNTSASTVVYRSAGFPPLQNVVFQSAFSISQRVANQDIYVGLESATVSPIRYFARFHFSGTSNTTVITESAYNPTTDPSSSETESTTVTLPGSATTASVNTYRVDYQYDVVRFYINEALIATHTAKMPHINMQSINAQFRGVNSGAVTATSIVNNYLFIRAFSRLDTYLQQTTVAQENKTRKTITGSASATFTAVAAVTGRRIKVYSLSLITASTTAVTVTFKDGASGTAIGTYPLQAITGTNFGITENVKSPDVLFQTSPGTLLEMSFSAAQSVTYNMRYFDDDQA